MFSSAGGVGWGDLTYLEIFIQCSILVEDYQSSEVFMQGYQNMINGVQEKITFHSYWSHLPMLVLLSIWSILFM